MNHWFFIRVKDTIVGLFKPAYKTPDKQRLSNDREYMAYRAETRKEIDRLLDKIARYGIKSLTKKERTFLDNNRNS